MLVDSWYDPYLGVVILVRVIDGVLKKGQQIKHHGHRTPPTWSTASAASAPRSRSSTSSAPARSASSPRRSRKSPRPASATPSPTTQRPDRRRRCPASSQSSRWCSAACSRSTPRDFEKLRDSLDKLRLNDASFSFEMETQRGARLRLPLRLPRPAPPRDHPGAADPRIRPRPHHHRAVGRLPHPPAPTATVQRAAQPGRHARPQADRDDRGAVDRGDHLRPTNISARSSSSARTGAASRRTSPMSARRAMLTYELPLNEVVFDFYDRLKSITQRLCQLRLPPDRPPRGRPRQDEHPGQRRAGRRAVDDRPPRHRRDARPRHVRAAEGPDPAAPVQDPDPGRDRRQGHRPRDDQRRCART